MRVATLNKATLLVYIELIEDVKNSATWAAYRETEALLATSTESGKHLLFLACCVVFRNPPIIPMQLTKLRLFKTNVKSVLLYG